MSTYLVIYIFQYLLNNSLRKTINCKKNLSWLLRFRCYYKKTNDKTVQILIIN